MPRNKPKPKKKQKVKVKRTNKRGRGNPVQQQTLDEAFELYCDKIPFAQISRRLNVSLVTIRKYRIKDKWEERKNKRLAKTAEKIDDQFARNKVRQLNLARALQSKGYDALQTVGKEDGIKMSAADVKNFIVDGVKLEREIDGEVNPDVKIVVIFPPELSGL
jgi:hypothetical protein